MIFLKILMSIIGSKTQRNSTSFLKLLTGNPLFPGKNIVHQLDMMNDLLGTPFVKLLEGWGTRKLEDTWGAWGWRSLFVFHIGFHMTISIFVFYKSCCLLSSMNGLQLKRREKQTYYSVSITGTTQQKKCSSWWSEDERFRFMKYMLFNEEYVFCCNI